MDQQDAKREKRTTITTLSAAEICRLTQLWAGGRYAAVVVADTAEGIAAAALLFATGARSVGPKPSVAVECAATRHDGGGGNTPTDEVAPQYRHKKIFFFVGFAAVYIYIGELSIACATVPAYDTIQSGLPPRESC